MLFRYESIKIAASAALLTLVSGGIVIGQTPAAPQAAVAPSTKAAKGIPPRANPGEYQSRAQVGTVTIAADFNRHAVPTPEALLTTEDFISVEVAVFGPTGARLQISSADFSLRMNGKKTPLPVEQFAAIFKNLRDPSYFAPEMQAAKSSSKGSVGTGDAEGTAPPPVFHVPPAMERAMSERVSNAALPEGDRSLPVDGLIFFRYSGAEKGMHSVELLYNGPAGKATFALQP